MKAGPKWSGHHGAAEPDRLADRPGPPASAEVVVVAADQKPANMVLADLQLGAVAAGMITTSPLARPSA